MSYIPAELLLTGGVTHLWVVDAQARDSKILILFHLGFYDFIHCAFAVVQN
jgi:hypothetical protein